MNLDEEWTGIASREQRFNSMYSQYYQDRINWCNSEININDWYLRSPEYNYYAAQYSPHVWMFRHKRSALLFALRWS